MIRALSDLTLLGYAFRPLFLGLGAFAIVTMALWVGALTGMGAQWLPHYDALWHGHEMLFGFALAAVAGFVLTAVAAWTGRAPVNGALLLALVLAWLAGRVVMALWPTPTIETVYVALAFPVLLSLVVGHEIVRGGTVRNYPVIAIVTLLALCDLGFHLGLLSVMPGIERGALLSALFLFVILVTVIGGRIIPAFTGNWLRAHNRDRQPASAMPLEICTIALTIAGAGLAVAAPAHGATGIIAALAAIAHAVRLSRWCGLATLSEPLLLILHVAYAWIPIAFALLAASVFTDAIAFSTALHAFGLGGVATMILAVTTRVALGHTGRPLRAAPVTVIAYVLLNLTVLLRITAPASGAHYLTMIEIAALAWIAGWALFLLVYAQILVGPRVES